MWLKKIFPKIGRSKFEKLYASQLNLIINYKQRPTGPNQIAVSDLPQLPRRQSLSLQKHTRIPVVEAKIETHAG